jgi:hypothetical protein
MIQAKRSLRIVGVLLGGLIAGVGTVGWAQRPLSFSTPGGCLPDGAPISVAVGDFNGDGVLDLVVAHFYSGVVSVLLGVGDGTFGPERRFGEYLRAGSASLLVGASCRAGI